MRRSELRVRVDQQGGLEIVDPGFDCLDLLRAVDPAFRIHQAALPEPGLPSFIRLRRRTAGIARDQLTRLATPDLVELHDKAMRSQLTNIAGASLLDLKVEIAHRYLRSCRLCGHRCGVDRAGLEVGLCGLGREAIVAEQFVHIAEEPPINPSLVVNLTGCGLRCRYCQQWKLLDTPQVAGDLLELALWPALDTVGARSISFAGGNPDESLFAILGFLNGAPEGWSLPVVWNNHAYCTPEALRLLEGVVDIYLPDLKYGNNDCGRRWSGVPDYFDVARQAITQMLDHKVPVIVRMLVLPGHVDCCHRPALEWLAEAAAANLSLSVRTQYCPDWKITGTDGSMSVRPAPADTQSVREEAVRLGFKVVDSGRLDTALIHQSDAGT
jgi:putative pyruvate formate lyase activating enzyme